LAGADLPLLTTSAGRFSPFGPLAIAAPARDLSIAAHVDDSIEIRAMPYHAILGEFLGFMLGSWMRRAAGQQAFFIPASLLYGSRFEKPYGKYAMSDVRLYYARFPR
jgi:hypothetical protein